ncbi:MAG TPA: YezD family protein [Nitrospira sp.]|nr:YezD family protein [Nitrospira sp.]
MNYIEQLDRQKQQSIEEAVLLALKGIRYGSVEIIVHDSKVVQIERKEKTRFDSTSSRINPMGFQ